MAAVLELMKLPKPGESLEGDPDEDLRQLADEVKSQLGYTPLKQQVGMADEQRALRRQWLAAVHAVGAPCYTQESVAKYKAEKARAATPLHIRYARWVAVAVFFLLLFSVLGSLGVLLMTAAWPIFESGLMPRDINWAALVCLTGMIVAGGIVCWLGQFMMDALQGDLAKVEWIRRPLADYHQPIPVSALELARALKSRCLGAAFAVDELRVPTWSYRFGSDPFLVVEVAGETYYIAVWNEPRFDGELAR